MQQVHDYVGQIDQRQIAHVLPNLKVREPRARVHVENIRVVDAEFRKDPHIDAPQPAEQQKERAKAIHGCRAQLGDRLAIVDKVPAHVEEHRDEPHNHDAARANLEAKAKRVVLRQFRRVVVDGGEQVHLGLHCVAALKARRVDGDRVVNEPHQRGLHRDEKRHGRHGRLGGGGGRASDFAHRRRHGARFAGTRVARKGRRGAGRCARGQENGRRQIDLRRARQRIVHGGRRRGRGRTRRARQRIVGAHRVGRH